MIGVQCDDARDRSMVSEESFQKNGCLVDWAETAAYYGGSRV